MISCAKFWGIYGPIRFARAFEADVFWNETRAYIRPLTDEEPKRSLGPDGICASSPNQISGL
jgi:hypothetical protein